MNKCVRLKEITANISNEVNIFIFSLIIQNEFYFKNYFSRAIAQCVGRLLCTWQTPI